MLSAIAYHQIKSADILSKIDKRLRKKLKAKKDYTPDDIKETAEKIWHEIEIDAAEQVMLVSVSDQINEEVSQVYKESPAFVIHYEQNIIQTLKNRPAVAKGIICRTIDAFLFIGDTLNHNVCYDLEEEFESLGHKILKEENAQVLHTGMVAKLKKKVDEIIKSFEKTCYVKLKVEFKWILHTFANQKFCTLMKLFQEKWDEENNPLTILRRSKSQYLYVINERLKKGFNFDSDGIIAASCLVNAIKQKAIKTANRKRVQEILDIG
jgi:hypothetical protein